MGWLRRKAQRPVPFVEVPRGPRGGLGGRYFVMRGSAGRQRAWRKAAKALGLVLPDDASQIDVRMVLRRVRTERGPRTGVQVVLGGRVVGEPPDADELRRVLQVFDDVGADEIEVEGRVYRGQSGGWNGRVIV